jgi:hypothetical protein
MEVGGRAEDWAADRPLSTLELLMNLKLYGRLAGVAEEKLTLQALRRTAMRLRMDEGAEVGEMQAFLDSQEEAKLRVMTGEAAATAGRVVTPG